VLKLLCAMRGGHVKLVVSPTQEDYAARLAHAFEKCTHTHTKLHTKAGTASAVACVHRRAAASVAASVHRRADFAALTYYCCFF